jgi:hypothetical protein
MHGVEWIADGPHVLAVIIQPDVMTAQTTSISLDAITQQTGYLIYLAH